MAVVDIQIDKLKIVDCADDDEDMNIRLAIYVKNSKGQWDRKLSKSYNDVYVEEHGKIGNDSKCTFFIGERVSQTADVDEVKIDVFLHTLDGDGFNWGGHHAHTKEISALRKGLNNFHENKGNSNNPNTQGVYELDYSINVISKN